MREIKPGLYKHFKGGEYLVLYVAEHTETHEKVVVYQALYGEHKVWVRPYNMFASEVDHVKYPQVEQKYRFQDIETKEEIARA